ncbi:hypothetical protein F4808DRAFT_33307 [Astrocystis sublimbata]|nr:hypothetical protein F4808DRAFT_33307 [Astrocystis sublimbata]
MDKREPITTTNLGPVVSVLTWVIEASVIIAVGIKFTLSLIIPGKRNVEDAALFLATTSSIGFTIAISLAVPNGVGKHQETLSSDQLKPLQITLYAADIFLVLVLSCVQASVLIFLRDLTPSRAHRKWMEVVAGFIILFFIASFFAVIFPCHLPHVWQILGPHCVDQLAFWETFAAVNILIETTLVLFPILIVFPLRMNGARKAILISCFAARLIVIGSLGAQIYEAQRLWENVHDLSYHSWSYRLAVVLVQGLSIITACIPSIRNLLLSMESGMIQTGHLRLPSQNGAESEVPLDLITIGQISSNLSRNTDAQVTKPAASSMLGSDRI